MCKCENMGAPNIQLAVGNWMLPHFHTFTFSVPLRCGDEFGPRGCGDYACRGVPLPKKKGERHDRAERCGRKSLRERKHHRRVSARFRREFDRVIDGFACFGVSRLPRSRDLVRGGVVCEVCSAHRYFRGREYFLVLCSADGLQMLHGGADAPVVHALPIELAGLAAEVLLAVCTNMDFVLLPYGARLRIDATLQLGVDAQPTVQQDVLAVLAETLDRFKEAIDHPIVGVELTALNISVLHGEAKASGDVIDFFVHYFPVQYRLGFVLRVLAGYDFISERSLLGIGRDVFHMSLASCFCSPLRIGRFAPNGTRRPYRSPLMPVLVRLGDGSPYILCLLVNRILKLFAPDASLCGRAGRDNLLFQPVNKRKYGEKSFWSIFLNCAKRGKQRRRCTSFGGIHDVHFGGCGNQEVLCHATRACRVAQPETAVLRVQWILCCAPR